MIHVSQDYNKYAYRSFNDGLKGDIEKNIYETSVKDFDCKIHRPQRAGVIMYTIIKDEVFFGMGLDTRTHDITDFGGGVSYKIDKNAIIGALREFREETLEIFNKINMDDIMNSKVIYDENNLIIFIYITYDPVKICYKFNEKYNNIIENTNNLFKHKNKPEVCGIIWLNISEYNYSIKTIGIMFTRVKKFLEKIDDITKIL